jgi:hypothetical protein
LLFLLPPMMHLDVALFQAVLSDSLGFQVILFEIRQVCDISDSFSRKLCDRPVRKSHLRSILEENGCLGLRQHHDRSPIKLGISFSS